jgi:PleD family two-component response regulator
MIGADDILDASILIVDDQEVNVQLLAEMLREAGYRRIASTMDPHTVCALHDALTGLPNRRLLFDRLALAVAHAHRNKSTMAVMYVDLDGFKQINDALGHDYRIAARTDLLAVA